MNAARAMALHELLAGCADPGAAGGIVVHGLALDSRQVEAGGAFVALAGTQRHGITFAPAAVARGAVVILVEETGDTVPAPAASEGIGNREPGIRTAVGVPVIGVVRLRAHLGGIAARFYGEPSRTLCVIGVTGTNGKTSIVQLLAQALAANGRRVATIGTLGAGLQDALRAGERTTPDVIAVHGLIAGFRDAGATHVAMEVSSHALDQGRVDAVAFDMAVFTNLTRDHLDYHGTMQAYGAAKAKLFAWPGLRAAVVNIDDDFGRSLAANLPAGVARLRYGVGHAEAEVRATAIRADGGGLAFHLHTPWGEGEIASRLIGRFNVSNLLAVAACLGRLGFDLDAIRTTLAGLAPVAGRMNRLDSSANQPLVVVDYAHTPDALEQALTSVRVHCAGHLLCVFGCGGERDAGKRPEMGAIAERLADRIYITDDNPRGEDGDAIVAAIVAGLAHPERATVQRNRARAIALALADASTGDVVLIAGKGHEPYQEIGGVKYPFDDLVVARGALEARAC